MKLCIFECVKIDFIILDNLVVLLNVNISVCVVYVEVIFVMIGMVFVLVMVSFFLR